jgi:Zn-dependent protease
MEQNESVERTSVIYGPPPSPTAWQKLKKLLAPLGVIGVLFIKFFAKLKFILLPAVKFLPVILKTGGTMVLSIGFYALTWGWWFAVGFVLLLFVHESGHLLAARRLGLKVGAPVFIPFLGALIALKEAPRNAWIEAQVGIGGPMLGTLGAGVCEMCTWRPATRCSAPWLTPDSFSICSISRL